MIALNYEGIASLALSSRFQGFNPPWGFAPFVLGSKSLFQSQINHKTKLTISTIKAFPNFENKNMQYPEFYNQVETIKLYDPLSDFLGAFEEGIIEFSYLDVVKSAGHSCATMAGAYLVTLTALKALYKNEMPQRGGVKISIKGDIEEGVMGVISNTFSQITGATEISGFKGIGGNFARHSLLEFGADIKGAFRFERTDNGEAVDLVYNPIPPDDKQMGLMQKIMMKQASEADVKEFKELWQDRVKRTLLEHATDPNVIRIL